MKTGYLAILSIALFLVLATSVSAGELASSVETRLNGIDLGYGSTVAGMVGDVVPVRVIFEASKTEADVRVKVRIEGTREDVSASTERFDIVNGSIYSKLLNLQFPSDEKTLTRDYTLYVEIVSDNDRTERTYKVKMQRKSYTVSILSVDYPAKVDAGKTIPIKVVVKNTGFNRLDDNYVVVAIPSLNVVAREYLGDLVAVEDKCCEDEEDSVAKTVYLNIPLNAKQGVYEMQVSVYNEDAKTTVKKLIAVGQSASFKILTTKTSQEISAGGSATYELVVVNPSDELKVLSLSSVAGSNLNVEVPSVVTVGPKASKTIQVTATAPKNALPGTYSFSVDVNGEKLSFEAKVVESTSASSSTLALIVVLAIVLVVLLIVLAILLTKGKKQAEEVETSYY